MLVYRLLQAAYRHEPLSGQGAALYGGRWNPKGLSLLYTTESPALSLLEVLVHLNPKHIPPYYLVTLEVPDSIRSIQEHELPAAWRATGSSPLPSQTFLLDWLQKPDRLVVKVPSSVVPLMANYLINPRHALYATCRLVDSAPFEIDQRLYDPARRGH
jgi:RES domain-containing protein